MEEELGRKSYEEKQEVLLDSTNSPASSCDPNLGERYFIYFFQEYDVSMVF